MKEGEPHNSQEQQETTVETKSDDTPQEVFVSKISKAEKAEIEAGEESA